jgi:hypothetical protein
MAQKEFHIEKCVTVASTEVSPKGTKKYLENCIKDFVARGTCTKLCFLTGCHGKENGEDGIIYLECLSDQIRKGQSQTSSFYANWCNFFFLSLEGEDPREYDPATGQVTGIKTDATPDWAARKPVHVPKLFKNVKGKLSDLEIQIVDIAHYHGKPQELMEVLKKFKPSTLIIDWCFTRGAQQLSSSQLEDLSAR